MIVNPEVQITKKKLIESTVQLAILHHAICMFMKYWFGNLFGIAHEPCDMALKEILKFIMDRTAKRKCNAGVSYEHFV